VGELGASFRCVAIGLFTLLLALSISCPDPVPTGPGYETVVLPAAGGVVTCRSGIVIDVPAGAVPADTTIRIRRLSAGEALTVLAPLGIPEADVLFAWEALPNGLAFNLPVSFGLAGLDLGGVLPLAHELDLGAKTYSVSGAAQTSDPASGTLAIEVGHFSAYAQTAGRRVADGECAATPCRCGRIRVESADEDYICDNGDCQIIQSTVSVHFLDCPGEPVEESTLTEIGAACELTLELVPAQSEIAPNESTAVSAAASIGCAPLADQAVGFSATLGVMSPDAVPTDANGTCSSTFTAGGQTGTAVITGTATGVWHGYTVTTGGQTYYGPAIVKQKTATASVRIKNADERYRVTIAISGTDLRYYNPYMNGSWYYDYSISSYQAECTFDIFLDGDETTGTFSLDGESVAYTQALGSITVTPNGTSPATGVYCDTAYLGSVSAPSSSTLKFACGSFVDRETKTAHLYFLEPTIDCEVGGMGWFAKWVVHYNLIIEGSESWTDMTYDFACVANMVNEENIWFDFPLQDGYECSGDAWLGEWFAAWPTYHLTVSKIE